MKNSNQIEINDAVRLKTAIFNVGSPLYVIRYISNEYVLCEYIKFNAEELQYAESTFLISELEKIVTIQFQK